MSYFNESALEQAIMELLEDQGYTHLKGEQLHREKTELLLTEDLRTYLLNRYTHHHLTENELSRILHQLRTIPGTIYEANKIFCKYLSDGLIFPREDRTKKDIYLELIDYTNPENNIWKIVNQIEIEGNGGQIRIPDAVVYLNGLPIIILEFKSAVKENATIADAYTQLTTRYKRDIPDLFKYHAFLVISDGINNKYGTLFTPYEYFYSWRKINSEDTDQDGINSLTTMAQGLFRKDRLLSVLKNFIYFPDADKNDTKIICRYPQYFGATKLLSNIKNHMRPDGDGKGGTYFGTTGCGKSYTMLFLTRMLMKSPELRSPTILLISDRKDLDDQLAKQFLKAKTYIGDEKILNIDSRETLKTELQGRTSGGVYLTTIQKFTEDISLLTDRANVICISDEAHRSQLNLDKKVIITENGIKHQYGFAKYLHTSLPNATYVGFTGTPIDETLNVFGDIVDSYTMIESVNDGITVRLVYEGRAAKVSLNDTTVDAIENYYAKCELAGSNAYQIEESKKATTKLDVILGDVDRLRAIANDFITHYETRVCEGATVAGKAMFVCANRTIAYNLYQLIIQQRPEWAIPKFSPNETQLTAEDKKELKPIEMIQLVMTRNKDDPSDLFNMLGTSEDRKELARQFKNIKSNFKIAIVVDMWITGFDVPSLDAIYIDKPIQKHTLIQTISRVNRVYPGKDKGLIVDYIGIKRKMNEALRQYTDYKADEFEGIEESVRIVKDQLEILGQMFHNFNSHDFFHGTPKQQLICLNLAVEYIQLTEELELRFMRESKRMKQAYNLCSANDQITQEERNFIHFYLAVRSVLFKLTKGDSPDITQMNAYVRKLLEEAIISDGIEELFETEKQIAVDLFSDEYLNKINAILLPNTKIKVLQRLLAQAISDVKKVNKIMGVEFTDRLNEIVQEYNNRHHDEAYTKEVLDELINRFIDLLHDLKAEKSSFVSLGIDYEEKAFYDILKAVSRKYKFEYPEDKMILLSCKIKEIVDDRAHYTDWAVRDDIKASLQADLMVLLDEYGYPPITHDEVYLEVLDQAENFKKYAK